MISPQNIEQCVVWAYQPGTPFWEWQSVCDPLEVMSWLEVTFKVPSARNYIKVLEATFKVPSARFQDGCIQLFATLLKWSRNPPYRVPTPTSSTTDRILQCRYIENTFSYRNVFIAGNSDVGLQNKIRHLEGSWLFRNLYIMAASLFLWMPHGHCDVKLSACPCLVLYFSILRSERVRRKQVCTHTQGS